MKLADRLREIGIVNPYELVERGHPIIWRQVADGRGTASAWMVSVIGDESKSAPFIDRERPDWRSTVDIAINYCKLLFPDLKMVRGPWPNTYVPKVDLEKAMEKLKEQK